MIAFENINITGWEAAIRGMRNPMNSWDKSDSLFGVHWDVDDFTGYRLNGKSGDIEPDMIVDCHPANSEFYGTSWTVLGPNDHKLMMALNKGGPVESKYKRMIVVTMDIEAPLYWWKEYSTYHVGTVTNSCSTMHKIHAKEFEMDDFSHEHLDDERLEILGLTVDTLNRARNRFLVSKSKDDWWQMIQLLPSSYNQRRTVMLNYEVLTNIYHSRKNHKLDEWHGLCKLITTFPYSELITGEEQNENG